MGSDEAFETFLRQFRPHKPKALPTHGPLAIAVTLIAVGAVAVAIPLRLGFTRPHADAPIRPSASTPAASTHSEAGVKRDDQTTAVLSGSPRPSPVSGVKPSGRSSANDSVGVSASGIRQRLRVGGAVKPPTKRVDVKPVYPDDARAAGIEGVVVLDIVIGQDGSVIDARVLRSIPELDQAAVDAVLQWGYEPTLLDGEPVEVEMNVVINFSLQ